MTIGSVEFLNGAADRTYSDEVFEWIGSEPQRGFIAGTAATLGISAGAIAGAMAEEYDSYLLKPNSQASLDRYALEGQESCSTIERCCTRAAAWNGYPRLARHTSNDRLLGEAGNDYINADGGNQIMDGGADQDELAFQALIEIKDQHLKTRDLLLPLAVGMQVSAEIIQGKRTVLEYLLSPVQQVTSEAGMER